jgi:hypothetical protein
MHPAYPACHRLVFEIEIEIEIVFNFAEWHSVVIAAIAATAATAPLDSNYQFR